MAASFSAAGHGARPPLPPIALASFVVFSWAFVIVGGWTCLTSRTGDPGGIGMSGWIHSDDRTVVSIARLCPGSFLPETPGELDLAGSRSIGGRSPDVVVR
jgi:hypothetical protein